MALMNVLNRLSFKYCAVFVVLLFVYRVVCLLSAGQDLSAVQLFYFIYFIPLQIIGLYKYFSHMLYGICGGISTIVISNLYFHTQS